MHESEPGEDGVSGNHFTALVLAGRRPSGDAFGRITGVSDKVLIPVAGVAMLVRVVRTLRAAQYVNRVVVCGVDAAMLADQMELRAFMDAGEVALLDSRATPSASVLHALDRLPQCVPLLVTTADHPLLTAEMVDYFCKAALQTGGDVAVGLVGADVVRAAFPESKRTYLRFRAQAYCGSNLFALLSPAARRAPAAWMQVEQYRKRPWKMVRALGGVVLLRFLLGRLTLDAVVRLASRRIGIRAAPVILPYPDAAIDVDTPKDLALAEAILRQRGETGQRL
ncbi:MAG: NTP transferase domain-containing protein [Candidatus Binatia bacterium]